MQNEFLERLNVIRALTGVVGVCFPMSVKEKTLILARQAKGSLGKPGNIDVFERLAYHDYEILSYMKRSKNLSPGVAKKMVMDGVLEMSKSPTLTDGDIEDIYLQSDDRKTTRSLLQEQPRHKFSDKLLQTIFDDACQDVKAGDGILSDLATMNDLPQGMVNKLVDIALSPETRQGALTWKIGRNPNLSPHHVEAMRIHQNIDVRERVWGNSNATSLHDILENWKTVGEDERIGVVGNSNTPTEIRNLLLQEFNFRPDVVHVAIREPDILDESTRDLIKDNTSGEFDHMFPRQKDMPSNVWDALYGVD